MALVKPLFFNTTEGIEQEINPLLDTVAFGQVVLNGLNGVGLNANGQSITGLPAPAQPSDATNKQYVDAIAQGLNLKAACVALAAQNITLSGTQTLDGVSVVAGNRVLVIGQTDPKQNGIWVVQSGNWTRPIDFQAGAPAASSFTFVEQGTLYADNGYSCVTDPGLDTIDTSPLMWSQFSAAGLIMPGSGLSKNGNTLSVSLAATPGLQFTNGKLDAYLNVQGGLAKDTNGLRALLVNAGQQNATLAATNNGLSVLGVPSLFTVNGAATTANVTATNLNTLTQGTQTQADALHTHLSVLGANAVIGYHTCQGTLAAGDPVAWSATNNMLVRGDATIDAAARLIGVAGASGAAGAVIPIVKHGIAQNVFSGGIAGAPVFLNAGGGLTQTAPAGQSLRLVRVGWLTNATDLDVRFHDLGKRSA
ncbi:MAG: hypothetical protein EOO40_00165 [Deltaproteobacteria bacterium]|nr:MAG: hypothetical protein EOO40_00165 [Deltaproteobacteria bacterium]